MTDKTDRPAAGELPLSPEDVEEIVSILSKSDYESLDIETARFRLRVSRNGEGWTQEWTPVGEVTATSPVRKAESSDDGSPVVRAPLPGTFYRAPQPGAPPFVKVGDKVKPDTVVAIIETMKLMNPVHAGLEGEITEIVPENAEPVAADAILMKVKPA